MKRILLIVCLAFFYSNVAFALVHFGGKPYLKGFDFENDRVNISLVDSVKDGCMPRPNGVKDAFETELRRAGIKIKLPNISTKNFFTIDVLGFQLKDSPNCIYTFNVTLEQAVWVKPPQALESKMITPIIWSYRYLGIHPKDELQKYLEDFARSIVNDLFLELSRAKD